MAKPGRMIPLRQQVQQVLPVPGRGEGAEGYAGAQARYDGPAADHRLSVDEFNAAPRCHPRRRRCRRAWRWGRHADGRVQRRDRFHPGQQARGVQGRIRQAHRQAPRQLRPDRSLSLALGDGAEPGAIRDRDQNAGTVPSDTVADARASGGEAERGTPYAEGPPEPPALQVGQEGRAGEGRGGDPAGRGGSVPDYVPNRRLDHASNRITSEFDIGGCGGSI